MLMRPAPTGTGSAPKAARAKPASVKAQATNSPAIAPECAGNTAAESRPKVLASATPARTDPAKVSAAPPATMILAAMPSTINPAKAPVARIAQINANRSRGRRARETAGVAVFAEMRPRAPVIAASKAESANAVAKGNNALSPQPWAARNFHSGPNTAPPKPKPATITGVAMRADVVAAASPSAVE